MPHSATIATILSC